MWRGGQGSLVENTLLNLCVNFPADCGSRSVFSTRGPNSPTGFSGSDGGNDLIEMGMVISITIIYLNFCLKFVLNCGSNSRLYQLASHRNSNLAPITATKLFFFGLHLGLCLGHIWHWCRWSPVGATACLPLDYWLTVHIKQPSTTRAAASTWILPTVPS